MTNTSEKSRRIAKNTLLLYCRTLVTLFVSLFTSRVVLDVLGVDDYGIYNVVGGVVAMFSIISSSLSTAISRFLTYGLGKHDKEYLNKLFSTCVNIQIIISTIIVVLAELLGPWLINTKLNLPSGSIMAANWVFQFSVASFIIGLLSVPYNALIIAHERMSVFAYISIIEVSLKLLLVFSLYMFNGNKLILYGALMFVSTLIIRVIYGQYCARKFEESKYRFSNEKAISKEMFSFSGWSFFGNVAFMLNTQGVNILLNIFFGVVVNAARGIAGQVDAAISQFVNNFTTAISPQITKSYAEGNLEYMKSLVFRGAKFSLYLYLLFAIPIEIETPYILKLWLKEVPDYSIIFLRLTIVCTALMTLGNTALTAIFASGTIRRYQIVVSVVGVMVFPLTWIAFKLGYDAVTTYIIYAVIYSILILIRVIYLNKLFGFSINEFFIKVVIPLIMVAVASIILPLIIYSMMNESIIRLICVALTSSLSLIAFILCFGSTQNEKAFILSKVNPIINKITLRRLN